MKSLNANSAACIVWNIKIANTLTKIAIVSALAFGSIGIDGCFNQNSKQIKTIPLWKTPDNEEEKRLIQKAKDNYEKNKGVPDPNFITGYMIDGPVPQPSDLFI